VQRITLVFNPNARKPRKKPALLKRLEDRYAQKMRIRATQDLNELDGFMAEVAGSCGSGESLCFYGGDGSVARGLTSLIHCQGEKAPIPPVLVVRAGTINMICNFLKRRENAERTFELWDKGELSYFQEIPLIKVEIDGQPAQYGFIFAWGVGYRVLREYYARGANAPNVADAMVVAMKSFVSALHPDADNTELFGTEELGLKIDNQPVKNMPLRALTVGTLERASLGIRPFPQVKVKPGTFHVSGNGMPLMQVAWHAPTLLFGLNDQRKLASRPKIQLISAAHATALECKIPEGFTLDGEMFELKIPTIVRISSGPTVRFWSHLQSY